MSFKLNNYINKVISDIEKKDQEILRTAGRHLRGKIAGKIRKRRVSEPFQAPGRVIGELFRGLKNVTKKTVSIVGFLAPAYHALLLEFGTSKMARRPILYTTMREELDTLIRILSGRRIK